ncbi:HAD-IB family hydrolase [Nocardioides immobilis]|uniref:HAD-IB family hydrolase n=1 Tax=Nocardioides immobilis TaxID=2049295 RepID=A0A417Y759_9ACTN|nr:HAD-IB family hydrolase [Nocardioides immobilis]RHW28499.1 HAD-IB family hydrolase [Nocardioides immobilis]
MSIEPLLDAIRSGPQGPKVGAFFDFDGTLIDGYSATAVFAHRLKNLELSLGEVIETAKLMSGGTLSESQFVEVVTRGVSGWAGRAVEEMEDLGERIFRQSIAGNLFHDMWRVVKAHQRSGHTVVIATSATRLQVAPFARELGIKHIVCTELDEKDGRLTGRVRGRAPWGAGKIASVEDLADREGVSLADSYGYANGNEDVPFLAGVGIPCAVNPQPDLESYAASHSWSIIRLEGRPGRLDPKPLLRTTAMYGALVGAGTAGMVMGALTGRRRRSIDFATGVFSHVAAALGNIDVKVTGERHLWSHRPAVFLVNHQSSLIDVLVTTTILRGGFTAVVKREVADIPVIGQLLTMADFAFIDRSDGSQALDVFETAKERLADGVSIAIAPEGTRSFSPEVGAFKKGAFHLAMQAGVPIVPIVIRNAGELMWRDARTARPGIVDVVVHPPILTVGWAKADLDRAVDDVHRLYKDTLEEWPAGRSPAVEGIPS